MGKKILCCSLTTLSICISLTTAFCPLKQDVNFIEDCSLAPTPATKLVCEQYQTGDRKGRYAYCSFINSSSGTNPIPRNDIILPAAAVSSLPPRESNTVRCRTFACVCQKLRGTISRPNSECVLRNGAVLSKSIRKEYRMLSDNERTRYHNALRKFKNSQLYDRFAYWHYQYAQEGGAHQGPAFAPWHREFINRYEIALKEFDPTVSLPYWDSVLDQNLPNPLDSILWTDDFVGTTYDIGYVNTGPFGDWKTIAVYNRDPEPDKTDPEFRNYSRILGGTKIKRIFNTTGQLFTEEIVQGILTNNSIHRIFTSPTAREGCSIRLRWTHELPYSLEVAHGTIHNYIGGDFGSPQTAANDPLFFMLHSFVDLIWEVWRQSYQTPEEQENSYPQPSIYCHTPAHYLSNPMYPFYDENNQALKNSDGLSNIYSEFYEYEPRPMCNEFTLNCGSKYLFCDRSHGSLRCTSKIKLGGNCTGFTNNEDACFRGHCENGVCVEGAISDPFAQDAWSSLFVPSSEGGGDMPGTK